MDISSALRRAGASDVTVLIDTSATRTAFTAATEDLIAKANRGDLVIISFAGHGTQNKRASGSESEGPDGEFLLSLIAEEGPNTRERIRDKEIFS